MYHLRLDNNSGGLGYSLIGTVYLVDYLKLEVARELLRCYKEKQK